MSATAAGVDRIHGIDATTADIEYRIADTREEREAAFRLVYNSYLRAGLGEPNRYQARVTPYHLLETSEVFIATLRGETISTLSLIVDGELGVPMESVYPEEVAQLRARGFLLGEVSCLADRRDRFEEFFPVFVRLCRGMAQHAWRRGLSGLVAAVHPRHARFYRRFMHFESIGQLRSYPSVRNRPAVALCLDFDKVDRERPRSFDTFFGEWLPDDLVASHPITADQREYFRPMIDPSFVLAPLGGEGDAFGSGSVAAAGMALVAS